MKRKMDGAMILFLEIIFNIIFPNRVIIKIYCLFVLIVDIVWVISNTISAVFHSIYELFKPPSLKSVNLETAVVIGSGRGVGRELAIQLAKLGATVLCVDKNYISNKDTVDVIKRIKGTAFAYNVDITKIHNVEKLVVQMKKDVGFVSMLLYCCGIPSRKSLLTKPPQDIHATLDLTLTSYFWFVDQFMPDMKMRNHGHIVALTSVAGLSYIKDQIPLSMAQFAVQGLASSLMDDLRVNNIDGVHVTLMHIYPFIIEDDDRTDLKWRIPSYFGTISPRNAAKSILDSVRRNYTEESVPNHLLYFGRLLRILPRRATVLIRDLLDTGVDFV